MSNAPGNLAISHVGSRVLSRLYRAAKRRPHLDADLQTLATRPWARAILEHTNIHYTMNSLASMNSIASMFSLGSIDHGHHQASPKAKEAASARATRVLKQLESCLTEPRIQILVDGIAYAAKHTRRVRAGLAHVAARVPFLAYCRG